MLRNIIIKIQSYFVDGDEVSAYRSMVPSKVYIQYKKDGDNYVAYIDKIDDKKIQGMLITEGRTPEELQSNLNQLIYMKAKIPEKIRPYYGNMFEFPLDTYAQSSKKLTELTLVKA